MSMLPLDSPGVHIYKQELWQEDRSHPLWKGAEGKAIIKLT